MHPLDSFKADDSSLRTPNVEFPEDAVINRTIDGTIMSWNRGAERIFGYTFDEIMGKSFTLLIPTDRLDEEADIVARIKRGERVQDQETLGLNKDDSTVAISVHVSPIRNQAGTIVGLSYFASEVTPQKQPDEKMDEFNALLEGRIRIRTADLNEQNTQLQALCYTLAHDLKAPLRAQYGFAEIMMQSLEDGEDRDTLMKCATRILTGAKGMETLVTDLLAYTQIGRETVFLASASIREMVDVVTGDLAATLKAANARVKKGNLDFLVLAHAPFLRSVISNLISNAVKFVEKGAQPKVDISAEKRDQTIRLKVKDNGIGIAPEFHEKIFGIFERLHSRETYPGTGIGLAITKQGIARMNGKIGVESEIGKGSCFWIDLPISDRPLKKALA